MNSKWYIIEDNKELPTETDMFLCYEDKDGNKVFTIGGYYQQDDNPQHPYVVYDKMNDEIVEKVFAYMPFPKELF